MKKQNSLTEYKRCAHCGKVITKGRADRRKYCNPACKQAAWRERQEAQPTGSGSPALADVTLNQT